MIPLSGFDRRSLNLSPSLRALARFGPCARTTDPLSRDTEDDSASRDRSARSSFSLDHRQGRQDQAITRPQHPFTTSFDHRSVPSSDFSSQSIHYPYNLYDTIGYPAISTPANNKRIVVAPFFPKVDLAGGRALPVAR